MQKHNDFKANLLDIINKVSDTDAQIYSKKYDAALESIKPLDADDFIVSLIKGKYAHYSGKEVDANIEKLCPNYLFGNNDTAKNMGFREQGAPLAESVKNFITAMEHYAKLYKDIAANTREFIIYTAKINNLKGVYQAILAAHDSADDFSNPEKRNFIAKQYERLWVILKLNGITEFNTIDNRLCLALRGAEHNEAKYREIFDNEIKKALDDKPMLDYEVFATNGYTNRDKTFLTFFIARVEKYLRDRSNMPADEHSKGRYSVNQLCEHYQIDHILARNETNRSCFANEQEFDEKRNTLAGLLLLEKAQDIAYEEKLENYQNSELIWAQMLCKDFHETSNVKFQNIRTQLPELAAQFKPYDKFDKQALEERTKLLYELVKIIWEVE